MSRGWLGGLIVRAITCLIANAPRDWGTREIKASGSSRRRDYSASREGREMMVGAFFFQLRATSWTSSAEWLRAGQGWPGAGSFASIAALPQVSLATRLSVSLSFTFDLRLERVILEKVVSLFDITTDYSSTVDWQDPRLCPLRCCLVHGNRSTGCWYAQAIDASSLAIAPHESEIGPSRANDGQSYNGNCYRYEQIRLSCFDWTCLHPWINYIRALAVAPKTIRSWVHLSIFVTT
jgi:hypothetical protein